MKFGLMSEIQIPEPHTTMATSHCEVAIDRRSPCQADIWMRLLAECWLEDAVC